MSVSRLMWTKSTGRWARGGAEVAVRGDVAPGGTEVALRGSEVAATVAKWPAAARLRTRRRLAARRGPARSWVERGGCGDHEAYLGDGWARRNRRRRVLWRRRVSVEGGEGAPVELRRGG